MSGRGINPLWYVHKENGVVSACFACALYMVHTCLGDLSSWPPREAIHSGLGIFIVGR
mgnify:CR=1 FL=1